jgi:hypothetical protein
MLHGSFLCRGIRYEISGALTDALNCHCSMCRKVHGAAFRSRARVRSADFRLLSGEHLLTFFESSPGNHRGFCRVCGTPIVSKFDDHPSVLGLPLGALDDDPGVRPRMHVFVAYKDPCSRSPTTCRNSRKSHRQKRQPPIVRRPSRRDRRDDRGWGVKSAATRVKSRR